MQQLAKRGPGSGPGGDADGQRRRTARVSAQAHACGPQGPQQGKQPTEGKRPANRTLGASDAKQASAAAGDAEGARAARRQAENRPDFAVGSNENRKE